MYYVDTSVLAAYYCPELLSGKAEAFLQKKGTPYLSSLTEVELSSVLSKKVRMKELSLTDASRIAAQFQSHLISQHFLRLILEDHHYRLAKDWIQQFKIPLRSLDALHLAVANVARLPIVTADKNFAKSAKVLGIQTVWLHI